MQTYEDVLQDMGRKEEREEIAKNLLSLGINIDLIKKVTKLPNTVIKKLAKVLPPQSSTKKLSETA